MNKILLVAVVLVVVAGIGVSAFVDYGSVIEAVFSPSGAEDVFNETSGTPSATITTSTLAAGGGQAQQIVTADEIFTELEYNYASIGYGEAVFKIKNTGDLSWVKKAIEMEFVGENIQRYELYYWGETTRKVPVIVETCKDVNDVNVNGTTKRKDCTYETTYKDVLHYDWIPFTSLDVNAKEIKRIKIKAFWKPELGLHAREWIPSVDIDGDKITQVKWAWWNSSWGRKMPVTVNENASINRINEPIFINLTGITAATLTNCTKEVRVTAVFSGGETEIPSQAIAGKGIGGGTADYCDVVFLANVSSSATATSVTRNTTNFYVYWNTSHGEPTYEPDSSFIAVIDANYNWTLNNSEVAVYNAATLYSYVTYGMKMAKGASFSFIEPGGHAPNAQTSILEINGSVMKRIKVNISDSLAVDAAEVWISCFASYELCMFEINATLNASIQGWTSSFSAAGSFSNYSIVDSAWVNFTERAPAFDWDGGVMWESSDATILANAHGTNHTWIREDNRLGNFDYATAFAGAGHYQQYWWQGQNNTDWGTLAKYAYPLVYALGTEEEVGRIEIIQPTNGTILSAWFQIRVNVTNTTEIDRLTFLTLPDNKSGIIDNYYEPGRYWWKNVEVNKTGLYYMQIFFNQSGGLSDNQTVNFTVIYSNITDELWNETLFETDSFNYSLTIITKEFATNITSATFWFNGTGYTADIYEKNVVRYILNYTAAMPIVAVNNTDMAFRWEYTTVAPQETYVTNTTLKNTAVMHAYHLEPVNITFSAEDIVEGELFTTYGNMTRLVNTSAVSFAFTFVTSNGTSYAGSLVEALNKSVRYSAGTNAPLIANSSFMIPSSVNMSVNITFRGYSRLFAASRAINVSRMAILVNGSTLGVPTLSFEIHDEATQSLIADGSITTFEAWFTGISKPSSSVNRNYSFSNSSYDIYAFNIYPSSANYTIDATIIYGATGYSTRTYYLQNHYISNITDTIKLWLANESATSEIEFKVLDSANLPLSGVFLHIDWIDPGSGEYQTVTVLEMDNNGRGVTELDKGSGVSYRLRVYDTDNTNLLTTKEPVVFATTDTTYTIFIGAEPHFHPTDINCTCGYSNTTKLFSCSIVDSSGKVLEYRLVVRARDRTYHKYSTVSDETTNSTVDIVSTLTYTVTDETTANSYILYYKTDEGSAWKVSTCSGNIEIPSDLPIFGETGMFVLLIFMLVVIMLGLYHPAIPVIGVPLSFVFGIWLGIIKIGDGAIIGLTMVAAIIVILMAVRGR